MVIELKQRLGRFGRFQHRLSVVFRRTWKYGTHFMEFRAEDLFPSLLQDFGNCAGGVLGGISDGSLLQIRVSFKPTPSISKPQQTLFSDGHIGEIRIAGRHDPFIPARAAVVVESMTAITLLELMMQNMTSRMD